jgi:hypothetical protein
MIVSKDDKEDNSIENERHESILIVKEKVVVKFWQKAQ